MRERVELPSRQVLGLATVLLLAIFAVWIQHRDRPLIVHYSRDEVQWVAAAENYDQYGVWALRLQPIITPYPATLAESKVYQTGPPGLMLTVYATWSLFGRTPLAARLAPIFFCIIGAALVTALARRLYGSRAALLGLFFFGFTPLMIYFSGNINFEQFLLPFILGGMLLYRRWTISGGGLTAFLLVSFFAVWYSPFWFLILGLLTLHGLLTRGWKQAVSLWPIWLAALLALAIVIGLAAWYNPDYLAVLQDGLARRAVQLDSAFSAAALLEYVSRYFWLPTPVVTLLALVGLWQLGRHPLPLVERWFPAMLVVLTLVYNIVFWRATTAALYFPFYAIVALCLWAAVGGWALWHRRRDIVWRSALLALLVAFVYGSWHWSRLLHGVVELPAEALTWGRQVQAITGDRETVATNLAENGDLLEYHLRRRVAYRISPSDVVPDNPEGWGAYLYCGTDLPSSLRSAVVYEDSANHCYLVDLSP